MTGFDTARLDTLVKADRVHSSVYTDPELFALERERIFRRVWLYVGHESQVPKVGNFFTTRLGGEEVIVTRDKAGGIRAFANRCTHRSAKVCQVPTGNAGRFRCPYHGWTFGLDGGLVGVPLRPGYPDSFNLKDPALALAPVPRIALYRGFIFGSWAETGPELLAYLGPIKSAIDDLVDRAPDGEVEVGGGVHRHAYRGNWKLQMENLNDYAHPAFAHESSITAAKSAPRADDPEMRQDDIMAANGADNAYITNAGVTAYPGGHSFIGGLPVDHTATPEGEAAYRAALVARHGEARTNEILAVNRHVQIIYPTVAFQSIFQQIKVIDPVAPDLTEVTVWCFRLKGAPAEYHRAAVKFVNAANSPASLILTDDLSIYERMHVNMIARPGWIMLNNGYGRDVPDNTGGWHGSGYSEMPMRNQFATWRSYLQAA